MVSDLNELKEGWRTNNECDEYRLSLEELSMDEQMSQKKKFTHFFRYVSESLRIHFKQWALHLLFLGLFSNQPTATVVAKFIIGERRNIRNEEQFDKDQNCSINTKKYSSFLYNECDNAMLMQQRNLPVIKENGTAIALIAKGGDIWHDDACDILISFRNIYLKKYSVLPTNT